MADKTKKQQESTENGSPAEPVQHAPPTSAAQGTANISAPTLSGEPLRDPAESATAKDTERTPHGAVQEVAESRQAERISGQAQSAALEWFLGEVAQADQAETKTMRLNMGTEAEPRWIDWTIRSVDMDYMRRVRREAMNTREARRTGNVDEYRVNLQVTAEGTVEPNLTAATQQLWEQGVIAAPDVVEALKAAFQKKPGYIARLSAEIMGLSGFDEEDVQEATALEAAKNS